MCLILVAWDAHPAYRLVVAANRDEFFDRRSAPMAWWKDRGILGGRDLVAGGGWLTLSAGGRFAAVTNVRDFTRTDTALRSRGEIPVEFSAGVDSPEAYVRALRGDEFTGFNVLACDLESLWWANNWSAEGRAVAPGVHGLSNAALDTPWPKVVGGTSDFSDALDAGARADDLFAVLADRSIAPDELLPDTGAGLELERMLSSRFITSPDYGTNASTVLRIGRDGAWDVEERRFLRGVETGRVSFAGR